MFFKCGQVPWLGHVAPVVGGTVTKKMNITPAGTRKSGIFRIKWLEKCRGQLE